MNIIHINKKQAINNLRFFQSFEKKITVMIKANAYGRGISEIVEILKDEDVKLGVATIDEAKDLRKIWHKEILIVEPVSDFSQLEDFQFVVDSIEGLKTAQFLGLNKNCYLKINIGMNRFGISLNDRKLLKKIAKIEKKEQIRGILTHFPSLEKEEETKRQYKNFLKIRKIFGDLNLSISFGGTDCYKYDFACDEHRVGIGFYGYGMDNVKPIMSLESQIIKIFELKKGERLGYDGAFEAKYNMKIGIVGIGYGDGIDKKLTGAKVKINDSYCEILGKICMDCFFVDLTNAKAKVGEVATIFDDASYFAEYLNTIPYEILTRCTSVRGKRKVECGKN